MIVKFPENHIFITSSVVANLKDILKPCALSELKTFAKDPKKLEESLINFAKITVGLSATLFLAPVFLPMTLPAILALYLLGGFVALVVSLAFLNDSFPRDFALVGLPLFSIVFLSWILIESAARLAVATYSFVAAAAIDLMFSSLIVMGATLEAIGRISLAGIGFAASLTLFTIADTFGWLCDAILNFKFIQEIPHLDDSDVHSTLDDIQPKFSVQESIDAAGIKLSDFSQSILNGFHLESDISGADYTSQYSSNY